ncbi:alternative ribosome rescue aminoacyl-tRNA hydrolase ArfB [Blastomonas sp.]|uniref:alternative ribosome rescue aminoacyl-tRNA hydrolase ArfB n=1 Tax=Blastomonas sp. TaxID=1909299 RepID=UPI003592F333
MADIAIPDDAIVSEKFITASGPGGQNVNKVATAVQLHVNIYALGLPPLVYMRFKSLAGNKINQDGELVILARNHRTQEANRRVARERLAAMLTEAYKLPATRARTRLNRIGKTERLASKKSRGTIKKNRGRVDLD